MLVMLEVVDMVEEDVVEEKVVEKALALEVVRRWW